MGASLSSDEIDVSCNTRAEGVGVVLRELALMDGARRGAMLLECSSGDGWSVPRPLPSSRASSVIMSKCDDD